MAEERGAPRGSALAVRLVAALLAVAISMVAAAWYGAVAARRRRGLPLPLPLEPDRFPGVALGDLAAARGMDLGALFGCVAAPLIERSHGSPPSSSNEDDVRERPFDRERRHMWRA
jgi:hypothetical protein